MASTASSVIRSKGFAKTLRNDKWWLYPRHCSVRAHRIPGLWSMVGLASRFYWYSAGQEGFGGYLAPFYSPLIFIKEGVDGAAPIGHALLGPWPSWVAELAPAIAIVFSFWPFRGSFALPAIITGKRITGPLPERRRLVL